MSKEYATRIGTFLPTQQDLDDFAKGSLTLRLLQTFNRMTIWFKLFHDLRTNHEPSVLIAAAHSKVVEIWILVPLGLLHSSYTALRTIVDICTSYTFYYSHPMEWRSVCDNQADWESRAAIIEWHLHFTPGFRELQRSLGLRDALDRDYQELSSYVHGIPVAGLPTLKGIDRTSISDVDLEKFIQVAEKVDSNLNRLYLGVFHQDLPSLSTDNYRTITSGVDRRKLAAAGIVLPRV